MRDYRTYAVRLAVEGGGKVKAELVSVGDSGERSLKKIDAAGTKASRGLADLGGRVRFLKVGIGSLGVEALQELRYAAQLAGVEQQTLDMGLQRFTRRVAEAARGTGEAKQALAQMGIALKDQHGDIRSAEDLLSDVAEAFARVEDPAGRLRLAFKLFDSEGVAMVNVLVGGADALEATRRRARDLAGALFDERQAIEARTKAEEEAARLREKGKSLTEQLRNSEEAYADEVRELNTLLATGAINQETFARASEQAYDRMLRASDDWSDGVVRALRDYARESSDAATQFEQATTRALKAGEDAFVQWATTGKLSASDLFNSIAEEALRAAYRMAVIKPFGSLFEGIFSSIGGSIAGSLFGGGSGMIGDFPAPGPVMVAHTGGVIGEDVLPNRSVSPALFNNAPRFHAGGVVGGEMPIIAQRGETVFTPGQMRALGTELGQRPEVQVNVHVDNRAPGTEARAQWRSDGAGGLSLDIVVEQIEGQIARNIGRGEGLAPTMERRYGLNPAAGAYR